MAIIFPFLRLEINWFTLIIFILVLGYCYLFRQRL